MEENDLSLINTNGNLFTPSSTCGIYSKDGVVTVDGCLPTSIRSGDPFYLRVGTNNNNIEVTLGDCTTKLSEIAYPISFAQIETEIAPVYDRYFSDDEKKEWDFLNAYMPIVRGFYSFRNRFSIR